MSQQNPVHVKLTVPAKPGTTQNRPGFVQVIQTRPGGGTAVLQQKFPNTPPITVRSLPSNVLSSNTNTAIQYKRESEEIPGFNQQQYFQGPQAYGGAPLISLNANSMQNISGLPLANQGGNLLTSQGLGSIATSRKPCNCTKSNCLKLYCECFAQGQLCQNCNCTNCMNNLAHEEERRRAVKMTLERNPTAFNPKIGRGEGERRHTKGCNCKRSGCLKNYCECYEAKISCSDICRCQGCKNTEDSIERRSLLRLAALGSYKSRHSGSYKKHLSEPPPETLPHSFFTWEVIEAVVSCLLSQVDDAERRDLPPAAQERLVLEEFGRSIQRVITSAGKAQVRTTSPDVLHGNASDGDMGDDGRLDSIGHDSGHNMHDSPSYLNREPGEEEDERTDDEMEGEIEDHKADVLRQIRSRQVNQPYSSHRGGRHEIEEEEVDMNELMMPETTTVRTSKSRRGAGSSGEVRTSSRRHVPSRRFMDDDYL